MREILHALKEYDGVDISLKTISNDLAFLRQKALETIDRSAIEIATDYKTTVSNLEQLLELAWEHMRSTESESLKTGLYGIIHGLSMELLKVKSINDKIKKEIELTHAKELSQETRQKMEQLVAMDTEFQHTPVF